MKLLESILIILICILFAQPVFSNDAVTVQYCDLEFDVYIVDTKTSNLKFFWKRPAGEIFNTIENLSQWLLQQGDSLIFATNAGIFMEDFRPLGLYIENGKKLRPLNVRVKGYGNFYLKPNGVFYISNGKPGILETSRYSKFRGKVSFASQSGPLLVLSNVIHKKFRKESENRYIRNGVGVDIKGNVVFAISNQPVNFYTFASLFKENLKCPNALYLDGAISEMYLPEIGRNMSFGEFGAIIGVVR